MVFIVSLSVITLEGTIGKDAVEACIIEVPVRIPALVIVTQYEPGLLPFDEESDAIA
jgi:hypothetical protein